MFNLFQKKAATEGLVKEVVYLCIEIIYEQNNERIRKNWKYKKGNVEFFHVNIKSSL
jgi:hypothetical protein